MNLVDTMASHARKGTGVRVEVKVRDNMGRALGEGARTGKQLIEELVQCFGGGLQVRYIPGAQYVDFIRMELGAAINAKAFLTFEEPWAPTRARRSFLQKRLPCRVFS